MSYCRWGNKRNPDLYLYWGCEAITPKGKRIKDPLVIYPAPNNFDDRIYLTIPQVKHLIEMCQEYLADRKLEVKQ